MPATTRLDGVLQIWAALLRTVDSSRNDVFVQTKLTSRAL